MVVLDLGVCSDLDLGVLRVFWRYLPKVKNLKVWRVFKFDWGLNLMISDLDFCYRRWNMLVL